MKLAEFIQTEMEPLLQGWEEAVLEIAPEMEGEDRLALSKNTPLVCSCQEDHGTHRFQQGMSMLQMVQELRALRALVTAAWGDK